MMLLIEKYSMPPHMTATDMVAQLLAKRVWHDEKALRDKPRVTIGFRCVQCAQPSVWASLEIVRLVKSKARQCIIISSVDPFFTQHPHPKKCYVMTWSADERRFAKKNFAQIMTQQEAA